MLDRNLANDLLDRLRNVRRDGVLARERRGLARGAGDLGREALEEGAVLRELDGGDDGASGLDEDTLLFANLEALLLAYLDLLGHDRTNLLVLDDLAHLNLFDDEQAVGLADDSAVGLAHLRGAVLGFFDDLCGHAASLEREAALRALDVADRRRDFSGSGKGEEGQGGDEEELHGGG